MRYTLLLIGTAIWFSANTAAAADSDTCAAPLLSLAADGQVISGSKDAVRQAALRGDELRVGWRLTFGTGKGDFLQHWANAMFVTVFEGETFAQIPPIHRQGPVRGKAHVVLSPIFTQWHASIGTDGKLTHRFHDASEVTETPIAQTWCLTGAAAERCTRPSWRLVYRHDADGKPQEGDKQDLFRAIRRGDPIRLAWGAAGAQRSVEHNADPVFVTIASNREAYAQLPAHALQRDYADPANSRMDASNRQWRAIMGSDGTFDAASSVAGSGEVTRMPQRAAIRWLAFAPDPVCDTRPVPELASQGGVRRAE
jgi:hypothetical protein